MSRFIGCHSLFLLTACACCVPVRCGHDQAFRQSDDVSNRTIDEDVNDQVARKAGKFTEARSEPQQQKMARNGFLKHTKTVNAGADAAPSVLRRMEVAGRPSNHTQQKNDGSEREKMGVASNIVAPVCVVLAIVSTVGMIAWYCCIRSRK